MRSLPGRGTTRLFVPTGAKHDSPRWAARLSRGKQVVESTGGRFGVVLFPFLYELDEDYPFRPLHENGFWKNYEAHLEGLMEKLGPVMP